MQFKKMFYFHTKTFCTRIFLILVSVSLVSLYLARNSIVCEKNIEDGKIVSLNSKQQNDLPSPLSSQQNFIHESDYQYNLMEEIYGDNYEDFEMVNPVDCNEDFVNNNQLQQDHPCVVYLIRRNYLRKPTSSNVPYNLSKPDIINPSDGQSQSILRLLRNQTEGFFIESGALDGEFLSNTLFMERFLNWTGVLIEADQKAFRQLIARNRKAYVSPVCLSTKPYPIKVIFNASGWSGSFIVGEDDMSTKQKIPTYLYNQNKAYNEVIYTVQCFPLYSILLAIGRTTVDFFGLDVEGSEYKILKTIPWNKVDIKTLSVEWNHIPEGEAAMTRLMESNKYVKFGQIEMAYSREVVYVKDFLYDFRQYEFD